MTMMTMTVMMMMMIVIYSIVIYCQLLPLKPLGLIFPSLKWED